MYRCALVIAAVCVTVWLTGCGGSNADSMFAAAADTNAKRLGTLYMQFQVQNMKNRLCGPSDQAEFEAFIRSQNDEGLARIGVDKSKIAELFTSSRDNLPFKIRWEVQTFARGPAQPVVFEQEGVDGKYVVGFTGFLEKEVDQAEYDRLWSGEADDGS